MKLYIEIFNGTPDYTITFNPPVTGQPFTFSSPGIKQFEVLDNTTYLVHCEDSSSPNICTDSTYCTSGTGTTTTTTITPVTTTTTFTPTTTTTTTTVTPFTGTTTTTTFTPTTTTTTETTEATICVDCSFAFSGTGTQSIYLNVGELISGNQCGVIGDYWIDWHNGSVGGQIVFVSYNSGNTDADLIPILQKAPHPIVDGIIEGGVLFPIIKYVYIDGIKYSSQIIPGSLYSPDLGDAICLGTINVDLLECGIQSILPAGIYDYKLARSVGQGEKSRSLKFLIDQTTNYLAWKFYAITVPDQINMIYCREDGTVVELLDSMILGNTNDVTTNYQPVNYPTNSITIRTNQETPFVSDITNITYQSGDFIRINIVGNYYEEERDDTAWQLSLKCLENLNLGNMSDMSDITSSIIFYSGTTSCKWYLEYDTNKLISDINDTDWKYFDFHGAQNNVWNTNNGGSGDLDDFTEIKRIPDWPGNTCTANVLDDFITVVKDSTKFQIIFDSANDYQDYVDKIQVIHNSTGYQNYLASNNTQTEYYGHYEYRHFIGINTCDNITYDSGNKAIHYSSIITYDTSYEGGNKSGITFTLPAITNNTPTPTDCNFIHAEVDGVVNSINYNIPIIFSGVTNLRSSNSVLGHFYYYDTVSIQTVVYPYYANFVYEIMFNGIMNPISYGFMYDNAAKMYRIYQFDDRITITDINDPANNYRLERRIRLRTNIWTDTTYEIIKEVP